jgi:cytochrome P450
MIAQRRSQVKDGTLGKDLDLLDLFMDAKTDGGELLSDSQLRDIVLNFILAGRDTTAQALAWSFWIISTNPEILVNIRNEAVRVLGSDRMARFEDMKSLVYAHAFFYEVLRLYPSVPTNIKVCNQDDELPVSNVILISRMERLCKKGPA